MKAQKYVLAKAFSGAPTEENIKLIEFELDDELKENGQIKQTFILKFVSNVLFKLYI